MTSDRDLEAIPFKSYETGHFGSYVKFSIFLLGKYKCSYFFRRLGQKKKTVHTKLIKSELVLRADLESVHSTLKNPFLRIL